MLDEIEVRWPRSCPFCTLSHLNQLAFRPRGDVHRHRESQLRHLHAPAAAAERPRARRVKSSKRTKMSRYAAQAAAYSVRESVRSVRPRTRGPNRCLRVHERLSSFRHARIRTRWMRQATHATSDGVPLTACTSDAESRRTDPCRVRYDHSVRARPRFNLRRAPPRNAGRHRPAPRPRRRASAADISEPRRDAEETQTAMVWFIYIISRLARQMRGDIERHETMVG